MIPAEKTRTSRDDFIAFFKAILGYGVFFMTVILYYHEYRRMRRQPGNGTVR